MTKRLGFGDFLAPHHPIGEHPTLQFQRDLELAQWLDQLHYDEFWVGEHHSAGWETIASPEMFLVAAAERTKRIMLGTGVVSIAYHHPFNVAQRIVMLDHLSHGRAMLASVRGVAVGRGDARDRSDDAARADGRRVGRDLRLLGTNRRAVQLQGFVVRAEQRGAAASSAAGRIPVATRLTISPSGMKCAGKYGIGVLSVASYSEEGLMACRRSGTSARPPRASMGSISIGATGES